MGFIGSHFYEVTVCDISFNDVVVDGRLVVFKAELEVLHGRIVPFVSSVIGICGPQFNGETCRLSGCGNKSGCWAYDGIIGIHWKVFRAVITV